MLLACSECFKTKFLQPLHDKIWSTCEIMTDILDAFTRNEPHHFVLFISWTITVIATQIKIQMSEISIPYCNIQMQQVWPIKIVIFHFYTLGTILLICQYRCMRRRDPCVLFSGPYDSGLYLQVLIYLIIWICVWKCWLMHILVKISAVLNIHSQHLQGTWIY